MAGGPAGGGGALRARTRETRLGLGSLGVSQPGDCHMPTLVVLQSAPTLGLGAPTKFSPNARAVVSIGVSRDPGVHAPTRVDQEPIVSYTFLLLFNLNGRAA